MSATTRDARPRVKPILRALDAAHPRARTALDHRNAFELLVATILSARCTDEMVNRVTPALFARYPTPKALAAAPLTDVEALVRPTGFFHQKAKAITRCAHELVDRFGGRVPRRIEELVTLPGVARKTANVVLANCWPRPSSNHGIFVDTHVQRVAQRLALSDGADPDAIEADLMELVPESKWADFPHQLVIIGRGPCNARRPDHEHCPLLRWCPTGQDALKGGRASRPTALSRGAARAR